MTFTLRYNNAGASTSHWTKREGIFKNLVGLTFSLAATPVPESGWRCHRSGPARRCQRGRTWPTCPDPPHNYNSPTRGIKQSAWWRRSEQCFSSSAAAGQMARNLVHLLHDGSQLGVRWLVHLVPLNRNFNLLVKLKDDYGILEVARKQSHIS